MAEKHTHCSLSLPDDWEFGSQHPCLMAHSLLYLQLRGTNALFWPLQVLAYMWLTHKDTQESRNKAFIFKETAVFLCKTYT